MLRWLILLASINRLTNTSSLRWCTGSDALDSMPAHATREEIKMLQDLQREVSFSTRKLAKAAGKGPLVTEKLVERAMREARDVMHDRVHQREVQEAISAPGEAMEMIPEEAFLPRTDRASRSEQ